MRNGQITTHQENPLSSIRAGRTAVVLALVLGGVAPLRAADKLGFNRDIRPILAENCFACHGPDKHSRKGGFRLDVAEEALGQGAIVPGKPEESELVHRVFSDNPKKVMPPSKSAKPLSADQKETLRRWIAAGAEYQPHWAFIAPKRPQPPAVKNAAWVRNPIDRFVLAELEKRGLQPAAEADRRTLARRVSLDLTGLPPVPAEVEAFVQDPASDAYERFVDRLLESPHWGEHRAHYWLDAARYADTHGIHFDNYREIWTYRDWVINAFNRNQPFDQFTVEQLAGDLLPNPTLDQRIASGFNRCNITTNEGGAIPEEYLVLYARDRTETTARVWLGLTANCAVCHDHKFDPLSQREFYQLSAFFNNITQGGMDGNIKDTPPVIIVPRPEDRPRLEALEKEVVAARQQLETRRLLAHTEFDKWLAGSDPTQVASRIPEEALWLHAGLSDGDNMTLHWTADGKPRTAALSSGAAWEPGYVGTKAYHSQPGSVVEIPDADRLDWGQPFSYGAWVSLPKGNASGAVMAHMDDQHNYRGWDLWIENGRLGTHIIHKWPEDGLKVLSRQPLAAGQWNHLFVTYDGSGKAAGVKVYVNGIAQNTEILTDHLEHSIRTPVPMKLAQRNSKDRINDMLLEDVRIYQRTLDGPEVERLARGTRAAWLAGQPQDKRTAVQKDELFAWWLTTLDPAYPLFAEKVASLEREEKSIRARDTLGYVMQERLESPSAYLLFRGAYDQRREQVHPGTPRFLPPLPADLPRTRLGLARWLVQPDNPLMARVTVNRSWQELFGTGIVRTSEDFGITGDLPSHPELLDWLAVEFRESGWDLKRFFKLLITSAAYRQAANTTPEKLEKDPQNRLLSRGPRFRMDAEMIRDYALSVSGLLVEKIGGPSVRPYQPGGVWEAVAMIESNTRHYKQDSGANLYRRSLYTFWKRAAPPASLDIFNAPSRETCLVRRERTDTPLQALVTLNDPQYVEAARHLAQETLKKGGAKPDLLIDFMARRLLARPLRPEETKLVAASLADLVTFYQAHITDARQLIAVGESKADPALDIPTLAAWTMVANQLLNLDEVLNK